MSVERWRPDGQSVPEAWERRLYNAIPPSQGSTWLKPRWEKGDPWEPVNRWVIWQMFPAKTLCDPGTDLLKPYYADMVRELEGPAPRSQGHYCGAGWCPCDVKANRWRDGAAFLIDQAQWELWQETHCVASRWWIVQGDKGGHRYRLSTIESALYRMAVGDPRAQWPSPCELPYAPLDERVWEQVRKFEQVRAWQATLAYLGKQPSKDQDEDAAERELRTMLGDWFKEQMYQAREGMTASEKADLFEARPVGLGKEVLGDAHCDYDARQDDFIQRG